MKFWIYIGEFFLFRWLFGKLDKTNKAQKDNCVNTIIDSVVIDEPPCAVVPSTTPNSLQEVNSLDDDVVEELDDLDIFIRNNPPKKYKNSDYVFSKRLHASSGSKYDCNGNYNQSINDFHEEQDDYDMMDDF
ncbi:MAG: hypothetical protein K2K84_08365 [Muribaculaceae bacterium]|nr:hypothetical protein [Muribaculaceae bacterium]